MALKEKDFIHEEYGRNPFPLWSWLGVVVSLSLLLLGASLFYFSKLSERYASSPFLQVTNRQISLFLWQNPHYMRVHVQSKNGYLPAFEYAEKIGLNPEYADDYAIAPPELLFLYHTWQRLLSHSVMPRRIPADEFRTFLNAVPEWTPRFWQAAPADYLALIDALPGLGDANLNTLSREALPAMVRQAFIGWKNYFFEGDQINNLAPKAKIMAQFLTLYPHYGRSYWCHIVGNFYLKHFTSQSKSPIPAEELSAFLRVALFNYLQAKKRN